MNWNEWIYETLRIVVILIGILLSGILLEGIRSKAEKKRENARRRFVRTELIPEIRDAVLDVIVEANEESMEMIPGKLKDIRQEMERE